MLIVGLGNPGAAYAYNRHNIGFMALDDIAERHRFAPFRAKFQGRLADGTLAERRVWLLKPMTFMNLSGQSVGEAMRFYKLEPGEVVVIHDEVDLAPGKCRAKRGGSTAGHNGLKSLDRHIGPDYWRIRLGVGHPGDRDRVPDYVLHDFAGSDEAWLDPLLEAVADAIPLMVAGHPDKFMSRVAFLTQPPKPDKEAPPT